MDTVESHKMPQVSYYRGELYSSVCIEFGTRDGIINVDSLAWRVQMFG